MSTCSVMSRSSGRDSRYSIGSFPALGGKVFTETISPGAGKEIDDKVFRKVKTAAEENLLLSSTILRIWENKSNEPLNGWFLEKRFSW